MLHKLVLELATAASTGRLKVQLVFLCDVSFTKKKKKKKPRTHTDTQANEVR